jgi:hypothetical protein
VYWISIPLHSAEGIENHASSCSSVCHTNVRSMQDDQSRRKRRWIRSYNSCFTSAATDFHDHRPPDPVRFRDVRVGHLTDRSGQDSYRLCGQFQGGNAAWTPFVTIKTSGYEQYIGVQASSYAAAFWTWPRKVTCRPRCRANWIPRDRIGKDLTGSAAAELRRERVELVRPRAQLMHPRFER